LPNSIEHFQAPKCRECDEPLDKVEYDTHEQYEFNPKTGTYRNSDPYGGSCEQKCPRCDADLSRIFGEGVANYFCGKKANKS